MADRHVTCSYKTCQDKAALDARVEVKTVLPRSKLQKKIQEKFLVNWKSNGEAEFHVQCWEALLKLCSSRVTKPKPGAVVMVKEEKALLRVASEAPEQFDSLEAVLEEARRVADWIKEAKHCVAFTGAGISTSAGIGDYRGKAGKWTEEDQNYKVDINSVFASTSDEPSSKKAKLDESVDSEEEDEEGVPYEKLRPTYTHEALVKLMEAGYLKYVISQNGDGLHGLSGIPKDKISELHGNVFIEKCVLCGEEYDRKFYVMDDVGSQYFEEMEDYGESNVDKPPHAKKCDRCGLSHRTGRKCDKKGASALKRWKIMVNQMWINHLMQRNVISHMTGKKCDKMVSSREISGPKVIKLFFMLNSGSQYFEEMEDYGESNVEKPPHAKKCERCDLSHKTGRKYDKKGCRGYLMDTIINFRDLLGEDILNRAKQNSKQCDVMLCLGTTLQVTPASDLVKKMKDMRRLVICNRQETPVDIQFGRKTASGEPNGSRVFGDCDIFLREIMKHIFSTKELDVWMKARDKRIKKYDKLRDAT